MVDGYKAGACGDSCTFDAAEAKAAYDAAGGYKGTLTMTYNADAPNKAWSEAVCNSIKNALGHRVHGGAHGRLRHFQQKIDANEDQGHLPRAAGRWTTRRSRTSWPRSTPRVRASN